MNPASVHLNAYLRDMSARLATGGLEEPVQLNMLGGQQVEPLVGNSLEVELAPIETSEVRIAPNFTGDGIVVVAARSSLDVHPDISIRTSSTRLARPSIVAGVLIVAKVLNGPIEALNDARGISSSGDRGSSGIANREAEGYEEGKHHEENSCLHYHLIG